MAITIKPIYQSATSDNPAYEISTGEWNQGSVCQLATANLVGRATAGSGNAEEIPCTSAGRALIDDADAAAQRTTLDLVTLQQSGRLDYVSTTQIKFACYNGDKIKVNGVWRDIPSAVIT